MLHVKVCWLIGTVYFITSVESLRIRRVRERSTRHDNHIEMMNAYRRVRNINRGAHARINLQTPFSTRVTGSVGAAQCGLITLLIT